MGIYGVAALLMLFLIAVFNAGVSSKEWRDAADSQLSKARALRRVPGGESLLPELSDGAVSRRSPRGEKRARPTNKKDGLPPGVNRKMIRLAKKIHVASTPFGIQLLSTLAPSPEKNCVMSPLSIHAALSMTLLGARGQTEKEILTTLGFKKAKLNKKQLHTAYQGLLTSLQNTGKDVQISTANGVFVKPNIPLEDAFRQGLNQMYSASFESFQVNHPQGPETPINSWISQQTNGKIQNLLSRGSVTPLTALMIVNAIYLKAFWKTPFSPRKTKPDTFYSLNNSAQTVDMMETENVHSYANHLDTEVVELPYKGDRFAMFILLPNESSSIGKLYQQLATSDWHGQFDRFVDQVQKLRLRLFLPKFKIESEVISLKEPLQKMGIVRAFHPGQADFSGISANGGLQIDSVLHKAVIEVNENGTEAAAATVVTIGLRSRPMPVQKEVKVNRPFMFVIRDKHLKEILFLGVYLGNQ